MPTVVEMERLGWGDPGDQGSTQALNYLATHCTTFREAGLSMKVRKEAKPLFHALILLMERNGTDLDAGPLDDWSYANRDIRGYPGSKSMHSWGLAIDLDSLKNVLGSEKTSFPIAKTIKAARACSLDWGYLWDGRKDPMHFEFRKARNDIPAAYARLQAAHPLIWQKVKPKS